MSRLIGLILLLGVLALILATGALLVSASGIIPIKASSGHWAITEWFLRFSMSRSMATHSLGTEVPKLDDPNLVLKGAGYYEVGCRACHGAPGERQPRIAQAMLPIPPELGPRIRKSNPEKLFQAVKHGIKLTGMPAWPAQERDDEVWAMVAFLLEYPELDQAGYRNLVNREPAPTAPIQTLAPTAAESPEPAAVNRTCIACHGRDGLGRNSTVFPKLAGQRRDYLENALLAYARGERHSGIMEPIAAGLSEQTMRELADYYSQLPGARRPTEAVSSVDGSAAAVIELGTKIAQEGIRERRVPACIECHGPRGKRAKNAYPVLAGQPADYLVLQLELFKNNQRGGSSYAHLMHQVAPHLRPDEMKAVARYFESLPSAAE